MRRMAVTNNRETANILTDYPEDQEHYQATNLDYSEAHGGELGASRQLRHLAFRNPGRFMEDFDPERSTREMRKMNRRIYSESRKNQVYDEHGLLMADGRDICDCLDETCPGCHFPCPKCRSCKCGADCRVNRRWLYQETEIEGTSEKIRFPGIPKPNK